MRYLPAALAALLAFACMPALSRDLGQWEAQDPAVAAWFRQAKMPDYPNVSCCGDADAYYADEFEVSKDGEYIAIITDTRDDGPLLRLHVPVGTRITVPAHKVGGQPQNPSGRGVIFLSPTQQVYCYFSPSLS